MASRNSEQYPYSSTHIRLLRQKGVGVSSETLSYFPQEKYPVSVVEEGMWTSKSIWMGPGNLAHLRFKFRIL